MSSIRSTHVDPVDAEAPRRRNGRQQACEPCRLRKVACDHRLPACSRCRRGRISDRCVYVAQQRRADHARPAAPPRGQCPSPLPSRPSRSASPPPLPEGNTGFLGPTSFSAVLQETQISLPAISSPWPEEDGAADVGPCRALDGATLREGIGVLRSVPSRETARMLFDRHRHSVDSWCRLASKRVLESLWAAYGSYLEGNRDEKSLGRLAQRLCHNSSTKLQEDQSDPDEWIASFSGKNIRWEALGALFVSWAYGAISLRDDVPLKEHRELTRHDRRKLMLRYKGMAAKCTQLAFGQGSSHGNTVLLHLVYDSCLLESIVTGDASRETWRLLGECVTLTTFMGLHTAPATTEDEWSVTVQVKRRLFAAVFCVDKIVATFSGRPPLLTRRYASVPLPLDIDDDLLLRPDLSQQSHGRHVDGNGWGTDDAILEIALQESAHIDVDVLFDLKRRERDAVSHFPAVIAYQEDDERLLTMNGRVFHTKLLVRLEHLQNLFFIERLLHKGGYSTGSELLNVSFEMVSLTLLFWTHHNRLGNLEDCLEWLVMSYAAPAGGVLCMELLHGTGHDAAGSTRTRSNLVQQLSMLVGFLDWVGPTAPNGDLCSSVKKVIRHALDEALNPSSTASGGMDGGVSWDMEFSTDLNEAFNFDLLDTFDWLRADGVSQLQ